LGKGSWTQIEKAPPSHVDVKDEKRLISRDEDADSLSHPSDTKLVLPVVQTQSTGSCSDTLRLPSDTGNRMRLGNKRVSWS
jgi:hypothetical protein